MNDEDDTHVYTVLVNGEEQYCLWDADLPIPQGWSATGPRGSKSACLDHVSKVWTDMRPLSLRNAITTAR
jgi:MbtH protein